MRREWWAWTVPWIVGTAVGWFAGDLVDLAGEARTVGLFGIIGIALGSCWYWLFPRPLIERVHPVGIAVLALSVLTLLLGGSLSQPTVRSVIGVGVLAGLIPAESWRPGAQWTRQRQTAPTSRETMREAR